MSYKALQRFRSLVQGQAALFLTYHVLFSLRTFAHAGPSAKLSPTYLLGLNPQITSSRRPAAHFLPHLTMGSIP